MTDEQHESLEPVLFDETLEFDFLPDLAERQATLRRANLALERARVLLEKVRKLDVPPPLLGGHQSSERTGE